jgi:hypothetical protein
LRMTRRITSSRLHCFSVIFIASAYPTEGRRGGKNH